MPPGGTLWSKYISFLHLPSSIIRNYTPRETTDCLNKKTAHCAWCDDGIYLVSSVYMYKLTGNPWDWDWDYPFTSPLHFTCTTKCPPLSDWQVNSDTTTADSSLVSTTVQPVLCRLLQGNAMISCQWETISTTSLGLLTLIWQRQRPSKN